MSGNEINEQHEETEHEHILQALSMFIEWGFAQDTQFTLDFSRSLQGSNRNPLLSMAIARPIHMLLNRYMA